MSSGTEPINVFKFMAIRPPQKVSTLEKGVRFFARKPGVYSGDITHEKKQLEILKLINSIGSKENLYEAKRISKQFVEDRSAFSENPEIDYKVEQLWLFFKSQLGSFNMAKFIQGINSIISPDLYTPPVDQPQRPEPDAANISFFTSLLLFIIRLFRGRKKAMDIRPKPIITIRPCAVTIKSSVQGFIEMFDQKVEGGEYNNTLRNLLWELLYALSADSASYPELREKVIMTLKVLNILESVSKIISAFSLKQYVNASPLVPKEFFPGIIKDTSYRKYRSSDGVFPSTPYMHPIGFGDLKVVKQKLVKYKMGEIAHVENVMKSEFRERKHRRLNRTEESYFSETETSTETEKDLQSTERFELQKETEKTISEDIKFDAGLSVSASYGPTVQIQADTNFALNESKTESDRVSSNYSKEIISRSISKICERVREERSQKTLEEVEETNTHGFDNKNGSGHVIGMYRWLDKLYKAQVVNYGKRLMYEFIIPEPAAFYIHSLSNKPVKGLEMDEPTLPMSPVNSGNKLDPLELDQNNYVSYVKRYEVSDAAIPPEEFVETSVILACPSKNNTDEIDLGDNRKVNITSKIEVPEGYNAIEFRVKGAAAPSGPYDRTRDTPYWSIWVGQHSVSDQSSSWTVTMDNVIDRNIPVILYGVNCWHVYVTVTVKCKRIDSIFTEWQLKTYQSIISAYKKLKADYNELKARIELENTVVIQGNNPVDNRSIEKLELKKSCINLLRRDLLNNNFMTEASKVDSGVDDKYPEIDKPALNNNCNEIQFFEQAYEWEQMTYLFYPYFWGRRENWIRDICFNDPDPIFKKFLQAGTARVILPVKEGYETAILHYMNTAEIWAGGEAPVMDDELFVSIAAELKAQADIVEPDMLTGEEWEITVPTSLVMLQENSTLPDFS